MSNSIQGVDSIVLTADGVACAFPALLHAVICAGGTSVDIYDNASAATGTRKAHVHPNNPMCLTSPIACSNGIYADITGAATVTIVYSRIV